MKNLVFIGMIGGKIKEVASQCADALDCKFVDTDEVLTRNTGMSLHDLYTLLPLDSFYDLTQRLAEQLSDGGSYVIAAGDSILRNAAAMKALKANSYVVYLKQTTDDIEANCADPTHPLLARGLSRLYELYNERKDSFIELSDIVFDYNKNSAELIVKAFLNNNASSESIGDPALNAFFKYYIENLSPNADSESFAKECTAAVYALIKKYTSEV